MAGLASLTLLAGIGLLASPTSAQVGSPGAQGGGPAGGAVVDQQVRVGVLGDFESDSIAELLDGGCVSATPITWDDDMSPYDVIVVNRPGDPGQDVFLQFLDDTDANGTGVVFLDTFSTLGNGVWLLWQYANNPSSRGTGFGSAIPYLFYEVVEEHPILEGYAADDEVIFEDTGSSMDHAWFGGYEGEGRVVVANAGRSDAGVLGAGIGAEDRANNRHVLLSMHASGPFSGPRFWESEGGFGVFRNSLFWAGLPECPTVDGGLVPGQVG